MPFSTGCHLLRCYIVIVLDRLGIETRLQFIITVCVVSLIAVTTLGGSGGAPWVFFTYRTLLVLIAILCAIGTGEAEFRICRIFLAGIGVVFAIVLIQIQRIPGSHFEAFYLWFKYGLFAVAFLNLASYARHRSARWKALLLAAIVVVNLAHLLPDLVLNRDIVKGFSTHNANYFATFLLVGLAVTIAAAVYAIHPVWRAAAAVAGAVILLGIVRTSSRGAVLAVGAMVAVAAIRARGRIPRQVWLAIVLTVLLAAVMTSPYLILKFFDRGDVDPYNYARKEIWLGSLQVISQHPVLGVGFGQYFHVSKRFTLPVEGLVARYMKRAQMAHNEYLQHIAELGIPAALLLFALLGYMVHLVVKRAQTVWPEFRCFHETALLTAVGVGIHALVDNCWTIPVTASSLVVLAVADPLPLRRLGSATDGTSSRWGWGKTRLAFVGLATAAVYILSTAIPGLGLFYNDLGHKAYEREDYATAQKYHLAAIAVVPDHPVFLDNLGMVYFQQFTENRDPALLPPAKEYFRRAMQASPRWIEPHIHMEALLARSLSGRPAEDLDINREIIRTDTALLEIDPYIPFARKNLAGAYYSIGQSDYAFQELKKAVEYEPNYVPGHLQLASWYKEHGNVDAGRHHTAVAMSIVTKYRLFKPTEPYEALLLGRPEQSWIPLTSSKR